MKLKFYRDEMFNAIEGGLNKATREQLAKLNQKYGSIANKRISRIQSQDLYSPALRGLEKKNIEHFSTAGKSRDELYRQYMIIQEFLDAKTSSVSGAKTYKSDVEHTLGLENVSNKALNTIWGVISRIKEVVPMIPNYQDLGNMIYDEIKYDADDYNEPDSRELEEMIQELAGKYTDEVIKMVEEQEKEFSDDIAKMKLHYNIKL